MMDIDTLVGRLMDLETKFYELQSRYHSLINDYETLKEEHARCVGQDAIESVRTTNIS